MGLYDQLLCRYPLPDGKDGIGLIFQTHDTPAQYLDVYEIRSDGTLWHEAYDYEDHSDHTAKGLARLAGSMGRVNKRWEQVHYHGDIVFYTGTRGDSWEYTARFTEGKLVRIEGGKTDLIS